jgi:ABC-2 type transport system permease protein
MPLHDVGYRPWRGVLRRGGDPQVIAATGIRLAWKSRWLRRVLLFAWSPALMFAAVFFAFEQALDEGAIGAGRAVSRRLDGFGMIGSLVADSLGGSLEDPAAARRIVWSRLLLAFMRAPQAVLLAVVVGLVAPRLIADDLRAKAWLVYFTRPVGRTEYVLGKSVILLLLVLVITMLPAVALWLMGVLVSPSISVAFETWDLPVRVIMASLVLAVPTVLLALAYSSLTAESRIASFAWFATWVACWIAHGALTTADFVASVRAEQAAAMENAERPRPAYRQASSPPGPFRGQFRWLARAAGIDARLDRWAWISPYHALGAVQAAIFGIDRRPAAWVPAAVTLLVMTIGSLLILAWRVTAPAKA